MSTIDDIIELSVSWGRIMRHNLMRLSIENHVNWLQLHVLWALAENRSMTMKELSQCLMVTAPTATTFADRLVKLGLVRRIADPTNRKIVRLVLTPSGQRQAKSSQRAQQLMMRRILGVLPTKEQRAMANIMRRLVTAHSTPMHHD